MLRSRPVPALLFFSLLAIGPLSVARAESMLIGHNLTPTTYTLPKGRATVGSYAVGYGITDDWMAATSPWIWIGYQMAMMESRYRFLHQDGFEVTLEGMYFKSLSGSRYQQHSTFLRLTGSRRFSDSYTLHVSSGHQYFWDATQPYSLNPWPGLRDYVPSVSMLNEFHVFDLWGILAEVGLLGLNYPAIERHLGLSAFYKNTWLLIQLGISETRSLNRNYANITHWQTHPEVQVQGYFDF
jgi:hypothetical protein